MDLIYTNAKLVDQGIFSAYALDMSYGAEENDFELILGANESMLEDGAVIFMENTEYGGVVGGLKTSTNSDTITYTGRTWHGILNSKVIEPNSGEDYLIVSGDANEVLAFIIARLGLSGLFVADVKLSGIDISIYQFHRYCKGYDGLRRMLADNGAKLRITWKDRCVVLSAVPIVDYSETPVDDDIAVLSVEQHSDKVNHLICLGAGNLSEREVIHLYVDQFGRIGDTKYFTGLAEITETYENTNSENLREDGINRFKELRNTDKAEIALSETEEIYDIGDIVGATEYRSGIKVTETVTQKIVKINNGVVSTEYKTGG